MRDRLQVNQKALTREIMMTELCNHHAFLDYNAHKPGAVASALYADGDSHHDGRCASGGENGRGRKSDKSTSGKRGNDSCGNSNGGNGNSSHAEAAKASGVFCSACECTGHDRAKYPTCMCEQCGGKGHSKSAYPSTDEGNILAQVVEEPFGSSDDEFANAVCEIAGGGVTDALMPRD